MKWRSDNPRSHMLNRAWERAQRIHERVTRAERAAYERGLRRGMAIANEHLVGVMGGWDRAEDAVEREIEEAKR